MDVQEQPHLYGLSNPGFLKKQEKWPNTFLKARHFSGKLLLYSSDFSEKVSLAEV